jgi:predicted PurR-regulated permease PerM
MIADQSLKMSIAIIAALACIAAASQASAVLAPLTLALLIIAVVWPLQSKLQSFLPTLLALAVVVLATAAACSFFALLGVWGFTRVARAFIADLRYQAMYDALSAWLDGHGLTIAGLWTEYFNRASLLSAVQQVATRLNTMLSLWLVALVYVILGLLEVNDVRQRLLAIENRTAAQAWHDGMAQTALKLRRYALVRTLMSLATGLLFGVAASLAGLELAVEWGVMAFALNYIPFIGPFVATLLPTVWAMTQFETWQAVLTLFVCLNIIQFTIGSYIEPRVAGSMLSISPFAVLFSVFFWTFLWGIFGAFIGVPITIAILTFCEQHDSTRWLSKLLGGSRAAGPEMSPDEGR